MTNQELLTKLAKECPTWEDAVSMEVHIQCITEDGFTLYTGVSKQEWLAERERLLNLQWDPIPPRYKFVAMHGDGRRWFFVNPPTLWEDRGLWELASGDGYHDYWEDENPPLAIPAGYDWRDSLEERPS